MKFKLISVIIFGFIASGCAMISGKSPNNNSHNSEKYQKYSDSDIKYNALNALDRYPNINKNGNVEITVFDHIILLLGQVPDKSNEIALANDMAKIPGVIKVFNQLTVGPPATFSDYTSDSWITTKVISTLLSEGISSSKFKIITENGVVYMMGVVSKYEGHRASIVASKVDGVKKVVNLYSYINPNIYPDDVKKPSVNQVQIDNGNALNPIY
ncbi:BON domain-containing protein [Francisellaceae bacterium]|nr:BON domain-containing protein [Francisellaceae bacterium]